MFNKKFSLILLVLSFFVIMGSVSASENITYYSDASGLDVDNNVSEVVVSDLKENNDTSASHAVENNNISLDSIDFSGVINESSSKSDLKTNLSDLNNKALYGSFNVVNISSSSEFKQAMSNCTQNGMSNFVFNLTGENYYFEANNDIVFNYNAGNLLIEGNGATIRGDGDVFIKLGMGANVLIRDCTFTNFKPPIRSYGTCTVIKCTFYNNKRASTFDMNYMYRRGGAIDSYNTLTCIDCSFMGNKGSYGGAVCCEEKSKATFVKCKWWDNDAGIKGSGQDIFVHNSAFAKILYNSSSYGSKPSYDYMESSGIQLIDLNENINNTKVINVTNSGELNKVLKDLFQHTFTATNITINLANTVYSVDCVEVLVKPKGGGISAESDYSGDERRGEAGAYIHPGMTLTVNGNGAVIKPAHVCTSRSYYPTHLFIIGYSASLYLNNMVIEGFQTAVVNKGGLCCNNAIFKDNKYLYFRHDRFGGAIRNLGTLVVNNTQFLNNNAMQGGAIYNAGQAYIDKSCVFDGNTAHEGDFRSIISSSFDYELVRADIYDNGGLIKINAPLSYKCIINYENIMSSTILYENQNQLSMPLNYTLNITKDYGIADQSKIFNVLTGLTVMIDGQKHTIKGILSDKSHFLINQGGNVVLKNMILDGFSKAIINQKGSIVCINITFKNCKADSGAADDFGGAVHNAGSMYFINCTFINNYAKYGAAVYNLGVIEYINCAANNNVAFEGGAGFYDKGGYSIFDGCNLTNSKYVFFEDPSMAFMRGTALAQSLIQIPVTIGGFVLGALTAGLGGAYIIAVVATSIDIAIYHGVNDANHIPVSRGTYALYGGLKLLDYMGLVSMAYTLGATGIKELCELNLLEKQEVVVDTEVDLQSEDIGMHYSQTPNENNFCYQGALIEESEGNQLFKIADGSNFKYRGLITVETMNAYNADLDTPDAIIKCVRDVFYNDLTNCRIACYGVINDMVVFEFTPK
jgi:hypothetical protein